MDAEKCRTRHVDELFAPNVPPAATPLEEFCFLISFLDRVFLKLFGYSGDYFDWRDFPQDQGKTRTLP